MGRSAERLRVTLTALRRNPTFDRLLASRLTGIVEARFRRNPFGLQLTIGIAGAGLFLFLFLAVVQDLIATDPLVQSDLRVMSLLQGLRSPAFDQVMVFVTFLGNWQLVFSGAALVAIYLSFSARWASIAALAVSLAGGEALVWATRYLLARPRPDLANALVVAQGPSFPSGHAFVAFSFYGLAAWLVIERTTTRWGKLLVAVLALVGIATLGFSRVFIGVHWPSDVLASFALGACWLTLIVTALNIARANGFEGDGGWRGPVLRRVVGAALAIIWAAIVTGYYTTHPFVEPAPTAVAQRAVSIENDLASAIFSDAPRSSEDITGTPIEPINVILSGTPAELNRSFELAKWQAADPLTISSSWRLFVAQMFQRPYPNAPGLPSFWSGQPNPLAFERPTVLNSAQERHHLHLWPTGLSVGGRPVWVGTVHLDTKGAISSHLPVPIHVIDPDVDKERDALLADLKSTGCVRILPEAQITQAMSGHNELGNTFFTDGRAIVASLECL
jgi:membrane-associated phospholipid phosphatase